MLLHSVIGTFLLVLSGGILGATEPTTPAPDPNKKICRRLIPTGSRVPPPAECHTKAQWDLLAAAARESSERFVRNGNGSAVVQ